MNQSYPVAVELVLPGFFAKGKCCADERTVISIFEFPLYISLFSLYLYIEIKTAISKRQIQRLQQLVCAHNIVNNQLSVDIVNSQRQITQFQIGSESFTECISSPNAKIGQGAVKPKSLLVEILLLGAFNEMPALVPKVWAPKDTPSS